MAEDIKEIQDKTLESDSKSSYRSIFKSTSLFGGVQVYQILIEIIKSKVIAVLLGPTGVGMQGLYTSATQLIQQLTSFGLSSSAVRNVAEANGTGDRNRIARVVYCLRRLVWITGLLGMFAVIVFSPLLSRTSFGDSNHIIPFIIISVSLLFTQLSAGQKVILQGTRHLGYLAKSSAIGVTLGLLIAVPLYYWFGVDGIVPNIVISSITVLALSWYFSRKVDVDKVTMTSKEVFYEGKAMLTMGIAMSITHLLASLSSYALRACIRLWGGVDAVGLFTAGYMLMTQYTGLVFKAMGTDFYPKLASVNQNNTKCREMMNQQGEVGILILAPLLVVCVIFMPFIVRLLYSDQFLGINPYIIWCSAGMLFKMASWAVSYVFIAKGESKIYMIIESSAAVYTLIFNLIGYKLYGLQGLGLSFFISYIVYLIEVYCVAYRKYSFTFKGELIRIFIIQFVLLLLSIVSVLVFPTIMKYTAGTLLIVLSCFFSFIELEKRMRIMNLLKTKIRK